MDILVVICWIFLCIQCLYLLKLWVGIPFMGRCTCNRSVVCRFPPPQTNWNIVESGVQHHKPSQTQSNQKPPKHLNLIRNHKTILISLWNIQYHYYIMVLYDYLSFSNYPSSVSWFVWFRWQNFDIFEIKS